MEEILIFVSSAIMLVGTYVVWFEKTNIIAHMNLGILFVAYLIPLYFTDLLRNYSTNLLDMYTTILSIGAFFYLIGILIGYYSFNTTFYFYKKTIFSSRNEAEIYNLIIKKIIYLTIFAITAIFVSWTIMGFIPMFAEQPLMAKFFRGAYEAAYLKIAFLYRMGQNTLVVLFPILIIIYYKYRKKRELIFIIITISIFAMSLTRGYVLSSLILVLFLLSSKNSVRFVMFLSLFLLVYVLGSASYYIISIVFNIESFGAFYNNDSIFTIISSGAPDIPDQIHFLELFSQNNEFTLGRTFFGGLIPNHYEWNPSVWALQIMSDTDLGEVMSGGLRLPVALWGYISFGYFGVVIIPFLSGMLMGFFTKKLKRFVSYRQPLKSILALMFFSYVHSFIIGFYIMSLYTIMSMLIIVFISYQYKYLKASNANN